MRYLSLEIAHFFIKQSKSSNENFGTIKKINLIKNKIYDLYHQK
jgi:hypothetical protein